MPVSPDETTQEDGDHGPNPDVGAGAAAEAHPHSRAESSGSLWGIELEEDEVEEAQPNKRITAPDTPTKEEVEAHRANGHIPYRSWCPHCVEGFGREWPHKSGCSSRTMPLISCDYLYITPTGVFARDEVSEDDRAAALCVLVAHCGSSKSMFAHAVPRKGADPDGYIVEQLMLDIIWLGHARVVIRSDNEPALLQVVEKVITALKAKGVHAASEGSVPYDPQSNGAAESAVR